MKVLIVSGVYYPNVFGGTEKVVQRLAEALVERGQEVVVVALNQTNNHEVNQINGVRVHYLPLRNIYFPGRPAERSFAAKVVWHGLDAYNPLMASALGRVLDVERPDVVNTHNIGGFSPAAWSAIRRRQLPLVNTTHGLNLLCPWYMSPGGKPCAAHCRRCRLYAAPGKAFSRQVDVLTGVSKYLLEVYDRYGAFPNAEKAVIYNACDLPSQAPNEIRDYSGPLRFGFLGRLLPSKGIDVLVREFIQLPSGQAELIVAGRGTPTYESELRGIADGHPGIRWLGFVPPEMLLRQAHVLVVPSLVNDSAPLAILEGLAHGLPIIGSARGGIPELIDQGTGWVFDPDEPGALGRVLGLTLRSRGKLAEISERARERASRFSTEAMARSYLEAYARAIEKN